MNRAGRMAGSTARGAAPGPTFKAITAIALGTLLEARRGRLPWVIAALAAAALGLSGFAGALALTEGDMLRTALLAALLRLTAAACVAVFAVLSAQGEAHGGGLQLLLAMAIPRCAYVAGKFAGLALLAAVIAAACGALLVLGAAPLQAGLWTLSLWCELLLAAGIGLMCALALPQPLPALAASAAFYLLARTAGALQLAALQTLRPGDAAQQWLARAFDAVSALLPRLDLYTRASWLIYGDGDINALLRIALQTGVALALLGAVALFDLHRKDV